MSQLESLLRDIPNAEREEALQYYNDYFDDAGGGKEQEVIEALGNPARVAENIKRDLYGGADESARQSAKPSDRAVIEYGAADREEGPAPKEESGQAAAFSGFGQRYESEAAGNAAGFPGGGYPGGTGDSQTAVGKRKGMPTWAVVLITVLAVIFFPLIISAAAGLFAAALGILVAWFAIIFSFGVTAVMLFVVLAFLMIVGGMCLPVDPLVGVGLMGGGLVCGGVGILFLMLTVALAGIVTPAFFRGIGWLFRRGRRSARKA